VAQTPTLPPWIHPVALIRQTLGDFCLPPEMQDLVIESFYPRGHATLRGSISGTNVLWCPMTGGTNVLNMANCRLDNQRLNMAAQREAAAKTQTEKKKAAQERKQVWKDASRPITLNDIHQYLAKREEGEVFEFIPGTSNCFRRIGFELEYIDDEVLDYGKPSAKVSCSAYPILPPLPSPSSLSDSSHTQLDIFEDEETTSNGRTNNDDGADDNADDEPNHDALYNVSPSSNFLPFPSSNSSSSSSATKRKLAEDDDNSRIQKRTRTTDHASTATSTLSPLRERLHVDPLQFPPSEDAWMVLMRTEPAFEETVSVFTNDEAVAVAIGSYPEIVRMTNPVMIKFNQCQHFRFLISCLCMFVLFLDLTCR
jgi:hypothetical protein